VGLSRYFCNVTITESSEDQGIKFATWRREDYLLSRMDARTEVTSMGQKVIFQMVKYLDLDSLSGRGLDDISGVPGQKVGFANCMFGNALLSSDRNDSNIKAFPNTPKDRGIVEYPALSKTHLLPRLQVLQKISQSIGSFLGLAAMGIRHLVRKMEPH